MPRPANDNNKPPPPPPGRVSGVTRQNYPLLAKKFMAAHAIHTGEGVDRKEISRGFMVAKETTSIKGLHIPESLMQWKAWKSYFLKKRISHSWMHHTNHYMVPAEWPYLFDADEP